MVPRVTFDQEKLIPGIYTHVQVCCRSMALFESLIGMLTEFAPILSFFRRSCELFEQMNSKDLEDAIEAVCEEIIRFCLGVVKYCRRKSAGEHPQTLSCKVFCLRWKQISWVCYSRPVWRLNSENITNV
jgi:hypothetical protein